MSSTKLPDDFRIHQLCEHEMFIGRIPPFLELSSGQFEDLWHMHPTTFPQIMMYGKLVQTPRWQQAYGRDYHYSGQTNRALPVPINLKPFLRWFKTIHPKINGLLINWYDGQLGHYIGKHRDSTQNLELDAPIVTISFGETRTFRVRQFRGAATIDFEANHGSVFVIPYVLVYRDGN